MKQQFLGLLWKYLQLFCSLEVSLGLKLTIWFLVKLRAVFKTTAIVLIWIPARKNFTIPTKREGSLHPLWRKLLLGIKWSIPSQFTTNCWTHPWWINNIRCPWTSGEKTGNCAGWVTLTGVHSVVQEHIAPFPMPHRRVQVWHFYHPSADMRWWVSYSIWFSHIISNMDSANEKYYNHEFDDGEALSSSSLSSSSPSPSTSIW